MAFWQILEYQTDEGEHHFRDWYGAQAPVVVATLEATLVTLGATEDWDDPELRSFKVFTRKPEHLGLAQIQFEVIEGKKKHQFRVLGLLRQEQKEFVVLMGFEKNGRSPNPPNAYDLALDLRMQIEDGRGLIYDYV